MYYSLFLFTIPYSWREIEIFSKSRRDPYFSFDKSYQLQLTEWHHMNYNRALWANSVYKNKATMTLQDKKNKYCFCLSKLNKTSRTWTFNLGYFLRALVQVKFSTFYCQQHTVLQVTMSPCSFGTGWLMEFHLCFCSFKRQCDLCKHLLLKECRTISLHTSKAKRNGTYCI